MSGSYLLDTNIAVQILNRQIGLETRRETGLEAYLCLTVVGELLFGAANSSKPEANRSRVNGLIELCPLVPHDLKAELKKKGRPIPENDIWIAAAALQHDLTLLTDDKHFEAVDDLKAEQW